MTCASQEYGKDQMDYAEFESFLTLPEGSLELHARLEASGCLRNGTNPVLMQGSMPGHKKLPSALAGVDIFSDGPRKVTQIV